MKYKVIPSSTYQDYFEIAFKRWFWFQWKTCGEYFSNSVHAHERVKELNSN